MTETRLAVDNNIVSGHPCGIQARESDHLVAGVNWFANTSDVCNSTVEPGYGTLYALVAVTHPTTGDPLFVRPASGNYHLQPGSAAIDAGVGSAVATDLDGQPRPAGAGPDLGADESWASCVALGQIAITGPAIAVAGAPVVLTASATPGGASAIVDFRWLPEPTAGQETAVATYTFANAGSQLVTAVARNCGGAVTASRSIGVGACGLDCSATAPAIAPPGQEAAFSATAVATACSDPVEFRWSFGDDSAAASGAAASHAYSSPGRFPWLLTVTSGDAVCARGGSISVEAKKGHLRRVLPLPPLAHGAVSPRCQAQRS